jgi:very-short-patch-repair endonuclease
VTRLRILDEGLPAPMSQVWIGPYRVDFYWPEHRLVLEADGRLKYTDDERWDEKRREQAIRRYRARVSRVERVTWSDVLSDWPQTAHLLRDALA